MALEHAEPGSSWPMHVLDAITAHPPGEDTWTHAAWLAMRHTKASTFVYDTFPYADFVEDPEGTLLLCFPEPIAQGLILSGALPTGVALAKTLVEQGFPGEHRTYTPDLADIERAIDEGFVLIATVDGGLLRGEASQIGHSVVVWAYDPDTLTIHDPGSHGTGHPDWRVPRALFRMAWSYLGEHRRELLGLRPST
jgi:hypothetical protein